MLVYEVTIKDTEETFEVSSEIAFVKGDIITRYTDKFRKIEKFEIVTREIRTEHIVRDTFKSFGDILLTVVPL